MSSRVSSSVVRRHISQVQLPDAVEIVGSRSRRSGVEKAQVEPERRIKRRAPSAPQQISGFRVARPPGAVSLVKPLHEHLVEVQMQMYGRPGREPRSPPLEERCDGADDAHCLVDLGRIHTAALGSLWEQNQITLSWLLGEGDNQTAHAYIEDFGSRVRHDHELVVVKPEHRVPEGPLKVSAKAFSIPFACICDLLRNGRGIVSPKLSC